MENIDVMSIYRYHHEENIDMMSILIFANITIPKLDEKENSFQWMLNEYNAHMIFIPSFFCYHSPDSN